MADETPGPRATLEMVYAGRRLNEQGTTRHWWLPVGEDTFVSWKAKEMNRPGGVIGGIYLVDTPVGDPGTIYPSTLRWSQRRSDDTERSGQWELMDREAAVTAAQRLAERKAKREGAALDQMTLAEARTWIKTGGNFHHGARIAVVLDVLGVR